MINKVQSTSFAPSFGQINKNLKAANLVSRFPKNKLKYLEMDKFFKDFNTNYNDNINIFMNRVSNAVKDAMEYTVIYFQDGKTMLGRAEENFYNPSAARILDMETSVQKAINNASDVSQVIDPRSEAVYNGIVNIITPETGNFIVRNPENLQQYEKLSENLKDNDEIKVSMERIIDCNNDAFRYTVTKFKDGKTLVGVSEENFYNPYVPRVLHMDKYIQKAIDNMGDVSQVISPEAKEVL